MTGQPAQSFPPVRVPGDEKLWELARAEAAAEPTLTAGQVSNLRRLCGPGVRTLAERAEAAADERGAA